jgi:hypothetical protein
VVDAGIVKYVAMRFETQSAVKAFCTALGVQDDRLIAAFFGHFNE